MQRLGTHQIATTAVTGLGLWLANPEDSVAIGQAGFMHPMHRGLEPLTILLRLLQLLQRTCVEGPQRPVFPLLVRTQEGDAVFVGHDHRILLVIPTRIKIAKIDLDHHHAQRPAAVMDTVGQIVAGQLADRSNAEKAPLTVLDGVVVIGAKIIVLSEKGHRLTPVARRNRHPTRVEHVDRFGLRRPVEILQIEVERPYPLRIGRLCQRADDHGMGGRNFRQIIVFVHRREQRCAEPRQPTFRDPLSLADTGLETIVIDSEADDRQ